MVDATTGTFRKENEKKRSKFNRDKFKYYMEELNECMGFEKLSINKCLSTAVSMVKLSRFSERFSSSLEGEKDTLALSPGMFYDVGNYIGLAFDENGRVLHISPRVAEHNLPFNLCNVGSFLSQICLNSKDIIRKVFAENSSHMEMRLKFSKRNKKPTTMFFSGKVLLIPNTQTKMFIGYSFIADKRDFARDPFMFNTGFEVWINSNYDVTKSNSWLELLIDEAVRPLKGDPINLLALLHPDDMGVIEHADKQMKENGRFKVSCRIFDGENYLWFYARGTPQKGDKDQPYAELYVWPFAYEDFKTGDMYLIEIKKLWSQRQKRCKIPKSSAETEKKAVKCKRVEEYVAKQITVEDLYSPNEPLHESLTTVDRHCTPPRELQVAVEVPMPLHRHYAEPILRKRLHSESSGSNPDSPDPKRFASPNFLPPPAQLTPPSGEDHIIRPTFHRSSAFAVHCGEKSVVPTFVPVTGNIPVMRVEPIICKIVKVEPFIEPKRFCCDEQVQQSALCCSSEPQCCEPARQCCESRPSPDTEAPANSALDRLEIERLVEMKGVLKELKRSNPGLYNKFANILEKDTESTSVLEFLPFIVKLQSRDLTLEGV